MAGNFELQILTATEGAMKHPHENSIRSVSIVGVGVMGRSIAEVVMRAGLPVCLFDEDRDAAASAVRSLQKNSVKRCTLSVAESVAEVASSDLVVETIPENYEMKIALLERIESHVRDETIIASNTSSLSITRLSASLRYPERFCGLHFCYPVNERPLLEVVRSETTAVETIDRATAFARAIELSPITVQDTPGFLLNRLLVPYMNEALELLLHGTKIETLDRAAKAFGMPLRPLELFDEFGFDVALAVGRSMYQAYPNRVAPSELLIAMYKSGRRGRKRNGGFYRNAEDARRGRIDPDVLDLINERRHADDDVSEDIVTRRLFLPMLLEATRMLSESLVSDPLAIDSALRMGLGLRNGYGGLIGWANAVGTRKIVDWLRPFQPLGERFEPTQLLLDSAENSSAISGRIAFAA